MFRTTIPNVDDNPEGLTPYEQAMRDKYLGDEHDDAEKTEDDEAAVSLKVARERFAKASIAVESHFFGKKKTTRSVGSCCKRIERERIGIHAS